MTKAQLKTAKIDAIVQLQIKYNHYSKALLTPGLDRVRVEKMLEQVRQEIEILEVELGLLGE